MRVALVCPYDWHAPGGVQVHVRQLGERLIAGGHEVLGLAPGRGEAAEPWMRLLARPLRIPYRGTVAPIAPWPGGLRRVRAELADFAPDVTHVHEPFTPSLGTFATLASSAPVVATFHAYLDRSRLLTVAKPVLRRVWRRIAVPIAVSEAAASFSVRRFGGEPLIIPNGVEVERFAAGSPRADAPAGRLVLWIGRLDPQKGFRVGLRGFELLARQLPDVRLVVAGDGPERGAVDDLPPQTRSRVTMLGRVDHDELPGWLASADVFVSPATGQESFGIVLVEAMAAGVPVVATDIAGYREVLRPDVEGLLVPPANAIALGTAMRRVLLDEHLAGRFGEAGRRRAAHFSWDRVVPRIEAAYERALTAKMLA